MARAEVQDLRVAVGLDPFLQGEPAIPNLGMLVEEVNPGIFETLIRRTPGFGIAPGLALRWEAETPTRWRFELRPGVSFHDGTPFNADAVVRTLGQVAGGTANSETENVARRQSRPRGLEPDSASADGDLAVVVALSQPNLRLAEQLADPRTAVQAPNTVAGAGTGPQQTPTGTGPFRFASYVPAVELRVEANAEHWEGPPELSSVTFRFGPDDDASRLLAARQVDAVGLVNPAALARVSGRTDRRVVSPGARAAFLLMNRGGVEEWATLRDDTVRRALALAIDRDAVVDQGWSDAAEVSDTLIPPLVLDAAADQVESLAQDPTEAARLLDGAGWVVGPGGVRVREGRRLTLALVLRRAELADAAEVVRRQLGEVGVEVEVMPPDGGGFSPLERVNAATFDLFLDMRPQDDANPCALCRFFSIRPGGVLSVAGVVGGGEVADALYDQVHQSPSIDTARRLAAELMEVVIADEVVAVPLATLPIPWLVSPRVQGFDPAGVAGFQTWDEVWLSR